MIDGLEAALAEAMTCGRGLWPHVTLDPSTLDRYVRDRSIPEQAVRERAVDLFLAAACASGEAAAIGIFERQYLAPVRSYVPRIALSDDMVDELRQLLRVRLLSERPPRIASYRGMGPLGAWVRVAAMRIAFDLLESKPRNDAEDRAMLAEHVVNSVAPEAELARARGRSLFESAIEEAIGALSDGDKALLRFHYIEGLSLDAVASMQRVHRATVARWLAEVRRRLLRNVEGRVVGALRMSPSEFRSLLGAVQEDLRVSIPRILGS
jgi:RNA polymerase sigma-70 factor (ECF subfamily)